MNTNQNAADSLFVQGIEEGKAYAAEHGLTVDDNWLEEFADNFEAYHGSLLTVVTIENDEYRNRYDI